MSRKNKNAGDRNRELESVRFQQRRENRSRFDHRASAQPSIAVKRVLPDVKNRMRGGDILKRWALEHGESGHGRG